MANHRLFQFANGARGAGLWQQIATEFSAVPDVTYPVPVDIVRDIRKDFDPNFVPLWVRRVYLTPSGGEVVRGFHMLARYIEHPLYEPSERVRVLTPTYGWSYNSGWIYPCSTLERCQCRCGAWKGRPDVCSQCGGQDLKRPDMPGRYVPFDRSVYLAMQQQFWAVKAKERGDRDVKESAMDAMFNSDKRALAALEAGRAQIMHDDSAYLRRLVEQGRIHSAPREPQTYVFQRGAV